MWWSRVYTSLRISDDALAEVLRVQQFTKPFDGPGSPDDFCSKYPPAKPGALEFWPLKAARGRLRGPKRCEPLKAAVGALTRPQVQ